MVLSCVLAVERNTKAAKVQNCSFRQKIPPRFYQLHPFRCPVYALDNYLQQGKNWKRGKLRSIRNVLGGRQTPESLTQYGLLKDRNRQERGMIKCVWWPTTARCSLPLNICACGYVDNIEINPLIFHHQRMAHLATRFCITQVFWYTRQQR